MKTSIRLSNSNSLRIPWEPQAADLAIRQTLTITHLNPTSV